MIWDCINLECYFNVFMLLLSCLSPMDFAPTRVYENVGSHDIKKEISNMYVLLDCGILQNMMILWNVELFSYTFIMHVWSPVLRIFLNPSHRKPRDIYNDNCVVTGGTVVCQLGQYVMPSRVGGFWTVPGFIPRYLPVNTVLGKTGFGHPKWEKHNSYFKQFSTSIKALIGPWNIYKHRS